MRNHEMRKKDISAAADKPKKSFSKIVYPELSYKINGILFDIRKDQGRFCNEKQYCDAIEHYLKKYKIAYEREKVLPPFFDGEKIGRNKVDFLINGKIIIEVKAKRTINKDDYYQLRRYLNSLGIKLGILVNFRQRQVVPKRVLNSSVKI